MHSVKNEKTLAVEIFRKTILQYDLASKYIRIFCENWRVHFRNFHTVQCHSYWLELLFFGNEHVTLISFWFCLLKMKYGVVILVLITMKSKTVLVAWMWLSISKVWRKKPSKIAHYVRCFGGHEKVAYFAIDRHLNYISSLPFKNLNKYIGTYMQT